MKILLISTHFAPEKTVGADRPNSIYRYGKSRGIDVCVIAAAASKPSVDPDRNIFHFESIANWRDHDQLRRKLAYQLFAKAIQQFFFYCDWFWIKNVYAGFDCSALGSVDAVHVVYPEFWGLWAGMHYSKKLGTPLFIDFTDSIMCDPLHRQNPVQRITNALFERYAVRRSAGVLAISDTCTRFFQSHYPKCNAVLVYNGFEEEDFSDVPFPDKSTYTRSGSRFRMAHFGSINKSRRRDVVPLFEGIALFNRRHERDSLKLKIDMYGNYTDEEQDLVKKLDLGDVVSFCGFIDKRTGFRKIRNECDYLLFYGTPGEASTVCSKLLEYLRIGIPILGVCEGNEAAAIIKRAGTGLSCGFTASSVAGLFEKAREGKVDFTPDAEYIRSFERKPQAARIFEFIHTTIKRA